jgi:hypothetical protein
MAIPTLSLILLLKHLHLPSITPIFSQYFLANLLIIKIQIFGFSLPTPPILTQLGSISNLSNSYIFIILFGSLDPCQFCF